MELSSDRAITRVLDIVVQVGSTGTLTPVAQLEPVELCGTTVSWASLRRRHVSHNLDVMLGDLVRIEKAGEIIPEVVAVEADARRGTERRFEMPRECPACGTEVQFRADHVALRCPNPQCPAVAKSRVQHFSGPCALSIEPLGEALIDQLVDKGLVRDVADLYDLEEIQLSDLPRMGQEKARHVVASIRESAHRPFDRLLTGLGIEHVGQTAAQRLAEAAGSLEQMLAWTPEQATSILSGLPGLGPEVVGSLSAFLFGSRSRQILEKLRARGVSRPVMTPSPTALTLAGASFCVAGTLSRRRDEIHADIRRAGGQVHDQLKKGTTYLVAGERVGATKIERARNHGIRILDEAAFSALLGGTECSRR